MSRNIFNFLLMHLMKKNNIFVKYVFDACKEVLGEMENFKVDISNYVIQRSFDIMPPNEDSEKDVMTTSVHSLL